MSYYRHSDKPDAPTQRIVDELRALHFDVQLIGQPVDLLVRAPGWPMNTWMLLEVKRPANKRGTPRLDKRQKAQAEFCARHQVPYVTSTEQALAALGVFRGLPDDFTVLPRRQP
jgi:hypothetical protein